MIRLLAALDLQVSIGVATGPVYCGTLGSRFRQEYTLMGDVVNTAARLMQKADLNILCDTRTHQKCSAFIEFATAVSFNLKGKQAPVTAYAPIAIKRPASNKVDGQLNVVVGRTDEQLKMLALFKQVQATSEQIGLFIEGEPGIGKTTLIRVLLDELNDKNNVVLFSSANAVTSTLYGIWQNLLLQVLGLDDRNNPQQTLVQLQSHIEKHQLAEFVNPLLPLLNHILGLSLEASELSAKMDNQVKADNTRRLILHLLQPLAAAAPLVIIIDDAHWMDSASWQLILELRRELSNCFFVLLNRPINELNAAIYQKILALDNTTLMQLSRFDNEQLITFVKTKLNVQHVTEQVTELIISRAEGHPLFCEELIKDLSARKIIETIDGRCIVSDDIDLSEELELPATIEMAITARLDRLSIRQQLIIKTASIIGLNFTLSELNYIYPVRAEINFIRAELEILGELGIIQQSQNTMGATYKFSQATLQRIAYDLMLISQRKFLHERVGEWLEQQHQDNLSDHYVSLANHYLKAERYNKTIKYLELAATQSLEAYANKEVVKYLRRAQRLVQEAGLGLAPVTIAHWYNMLGQAYLDLGDMPQAEQCSQQILRTFQHPVPSTTLGMLATITVQILRQFQHRYLPTTLKTLNTKRQAEAGQAAVAAERLFTVYFFSENALGFVYSAISAVNLAEGESKLTPILAKAYTNFAGGLAIVPLIALADHYAKRASFVAQRVNEGPTTAWLHVVLATYRAGIGRWLEVEMHTQTAMRHAIELGDQRRWEEAAGTYSITGVLSGKFDNSADEKNIYQQLYQSGIKRGVPQVQAWGLTFRTVVALMQGQNKLAATSGQALEIIVNKYKEQIDPATLLESYVCFAKLALLKKRYALCADWIKSSIDLSSGKGRSTRFAVVSGYYFLAETALRLYSIKGNTHEGLYLYYVNSSIKLLAKCRGIFPIAKSRHLLLRGWFEQLKGRPLKAHRFWLKALPLAQQYHMSYDILLLSLALQNRNVESPLILNAQEINEQLKKMSIVNKDYLGQWDLKLH